MTANSWWTYVEGTLDGDSALEAGRRAGFDSSAFTRWKKGARPDVDFVVKFARAYGRPVVEAIAAAGFITEAEADLREVQVGLHELSDLELAQELLSRVEAQAQLSDVPRITPTDSRFGRDVGGSREPVDLFSVRLEADEVAASTDDSSVDPDRG